MELSIIRMDGGSLLVLLDKQMRIVKPVFEFLKFQKLRQKADNTLRAYGWDLKTFFEFLDRYGYRYDEVEPATMGEFIEYLREPDIAGEVSSFYRVSVRTPRTINRVLGTVHSFYQYHVMVGGIDNPIIMQDINRPQEVLGHSSVLTAKKYYADVKDKDMAETLGRIGIIGNLSRLDEAMIPDEAERQWFMSNRDGAARMCDGYCTKPINNGSICERLMRRRKCYICSRFITTVEDLEAHRSHLRELEELLERNIYGEHYAAHFTPVVAVLKEIIRRLEEIDDGDE